MRFLDKEALSRLFTGLDDFLVERHLGPRSLMVVGSSVLVHEGMPFRYTEDVDLFGNEPGERAWLADALPGLGADFDPSDYAAAARPYVQWVDRRFVHMPASDAWMDDKVPLWSGRALALFRPPLGVLLGSKLAAARDKDMQDIGYLASSFQDWEASLARYIPDFTPADQAEIAANLPLARLMAASPTPAATTRRGKRTPK